MRKRPQETEGRLKSHCAGLIELRITIVDMDDLIVENSIQKVREDPEVQYLHKSVADFLEEEDVWKEVVEGTKGRISMRTAAFYNPSL